MELSVSVLQSSHPHSQPPEPLNPPELKLYPHETHDFHFHFLQPQAPPSYVVSLDVTSLGTSGGWDYTASDLL